jgi:DUF971 family protein
MPKSLDARKKPVEVKVQVSTGAGVDITWSDGHRSHYDFAYLRESCPCANCDDQRRKQREADATGASKNILPIFKPRASARGATAVGHYALQIEFTDGHSTGIYSYDYLREVCPCAECRALHRDEG